MKNRKGQGVLELVVAIGVIALVLGGVVTLLVQVMGARNKSFDRKKATRLANVVMESLVEEEKNSPSSFWTLRGRSDWSQTGFEGYVYSVGFTEVGKDEGCNKGDKACAQVVLAVGWSGSSEQGVTFTRFFAK